MNPLKNYLKIILKELNCLEQARLLAYYLWGHNSVNITREKKMFYFYKKFIKKGDLCFDIGANVGKHTSIFLKLNAKIICLEPQSSCIQKLEQTFGKNKNVTILGQGVGDQSGFVELSVCENALTLSTMSNKWKTKGRFKKNKWNKIEQVPMTTLDALIKEYGLPNFCKIDVEGFEEKVLKGLSKPIPILSFEFTKEFMKTAQDCVDILVLLGEYHFNFSVSESMELFLATWVTKDDLFRELNLLEDELIWGDIYAKLPNQSLLK